MANALPGENVEVCFKGSEISFNLGFQKMALELCRLVGLPAKSHLLVRWDDKETKVYHDNIPRKILAIVKKDIKRGRFVMHQDISDITGLSFSDDYHNLDPIDGEKVMCIITDDYIHGMYWDMSGELQQKDFQKDMGSLLKEMRYPHIYAALDNGAVDKLIAVGWFPFKEIIGSQCEQLISYVENGELEKLEAWSDITFSDEFVKGFTSRWTSYLVYNQKKTSIEAGLQCFYENNYAACIPTLIPLIEGVFNEYLLLKTGKGLSYKGTQITEQIINHALQKLEENSLTLPFKFKEYLKTYFFKNTQASTSDEIVRHTVSHGRSNDVGLTREKALQILFTLDQLFFFMKK